MKEKRTSCKTGRDAWITAIALLSLALAVTTPQRAVFGQPEVLSDAELTAKIRSAILDDSRLPIDGISIFVLDGAVRLKGVVELLAQKQWIQEILYQIPEVKVVDNQLEVLTNNYNDDELAAIVRQQLAGQQRHGLDYSRVTVSADNGRIKLAGAVRSLGARLHAEDVVAQIRGVRVFENKLDIRDTVNTTEEKIRQAVEQALREKIQMSRDYRIEVAVTQGQVTLKGRLRNEIERSRAVRTALFVPGVAEIIDKIEVLPN